MKKFLMIAGAAVALTFTACKKDSSDNSNNPGGGGTPGPSSKTLKKLTRKEDGVTTVFNVTYDGSKRLSAITSTDGKDVTAFTYDNNGNVTKVEANEDDYKYIFTYTYEGGKPVSGHYKGFNKVDGQPDELDTEYDLAYTVENDQVSKIKMTADGEEVNFDLTYSNGNLAKIQSTTESYPYSAEFTYGTKKPIFPKVFKYMLDEAGFANQFFAKNEIKSVHYDFPGSTMDKTVSSTYTYDSDGNVLTSKDDTTEMTFEYQ